MPRFKSGFLCQVPNVVFTQLRRACKVKRDWRKGKSALVSYCRGIHPPTLPRLIGPCNALLQSSACFPCKLNLSPFMGAGQWTGSLPSKWLSYIDCKLSANANRPYGRAGQGGFRFITSARVITLRGTPLECSNLRHVILWQCLLNGQCLKLRIMARESRDKVKICSFEQS